VDLDLVDGRHDIGLVEEPAQVGGLEVGDPDGAGPPVGVDPLEGLPRRHEVGDRRQGPVDQEEVDALDVEVGEGLVEGSEGIVVAVAVVVEFARHEDVGPVETRSGDGLADLLLVAVHLRGVDVAVPDA
jgi:hypothetical protein